MESILKKKNKKGQIFAGLTVGIVIVVALLILIFTAGILNFLKNNIFILLGAFLFVGGLIYLIKSQSDTRTKTIVFFVMLIIGSILVFSNGVLQQELGGEEVVKYAIPHNGAYECKAVGTGNPTYNIPIDGRYISKKSIGVYTDQVTDINIFIPSSWWDSYFINLIGGSIRAKYGYCDVDEKNCNLEYKNLMYSGKSSLPLKSTALNPLQESFFIAIQVRNSIVSSYKNVAVSGATLSYAYTKYGLKYISTTGNPAGSFFAGCESSCDLTCPEQKSREDTGLEYTTKNSLLPTESVPVLEYWEDLDIDLNQEFGATIYDGNKFCFGGAIYQKDSKKLDNGVTYIYPKQATRRNVECCEGAVISTLQEDKICQSDNTWKTITKDTRIKCVSDFNCPNQGQFTCQNNIKSGWSCGNDNYCSKDAINVQVECCSQADCPTDQTCQNNFCVGGGITPPIDLSTKELCDDNKDNDKDGLVDLNDPDCKELPPPSTCNPIFEQEISVDKTVGRGPLGIGKLFGWTKIETEKKCAPKSWVPIAVFGTIILILGLAAILVNKPRRRQSNKGRRR